MGLLRSGRPAGLGLPRSSRWLVPRRRSWSRSVPAEPDGSRWLLGRVGASELGGPRRFFDRADGSGMSTDTIPDDPDAKSSIIGRALTNICSVGVHLEMAEQTQRTCSTSQEARSRPRSTLYHGTAHSGVSGATSDRPTGSHLIRITQGSILGLLGVPARRRDDVGSRPTAAGGLAMYRSYCP